MPWQQTAVASGWDITIVLVRAHLLLLLLQYPGKHRTNICLGVPGTPTKPPTTTTPAGCAGAPTPTQPGAICACKTWHKVAKGDDCVTMEKQYGISAANFNKWNPQVGTTCSTLWLGYYVCVGA